MDESSSDIYLRAFEYDDLDLIHKWHNDTDINSLTAGRRFFISKEKDKKWIEDKMINNHDQVYCAVCKNEDNTMIGYISLNNIDLFNKKAHWGGLVIGNKDERNKGFATKAAVLMMKYGFFELGLQKISGKWISTHSVSIFMARMLGFKAEGTLRREVFKNNAYHDILVMSILKEEFENKLREIK